jgi:transcriptional regulator GlxA family with amidase domain
MVKPVLFVSGEVPNAAVPVLADAKIDRMTGLAGVRARRCEGAFAPEFSIRSWAMKTIAILAYEEAVLSSFSGAVDMLQVANGYLQSLGREPFFKIEIVSDRAPNPTRMSAPAQILCSRTLEQARDADIILVPAFNASPDAVLEKNAHIVRWLREQYEAGKEIGSLCFGAYFLAEAGLLEGKQATSHWLALPDMRLRYPNVELLPDVLMTDKDGIYTSGGALLSWNLVLYLVEKFVSRELAIAVSKMFNIDLDKGRQSHFTVFHGQRSHGDEHILNAQNYIESRYGEPISIEQVAAQALMSKRNFIRRFKKATGNTPMEYIQRVKIEAAKKALENSGGDVNSVMYDAGYNDLKSFRKVFRQVTGMTPQDYRRKFSRVGAATV